MAFIEAVDLPILLGPSAKGLGVVGDDRLEIVWTG